VYQAALTRGRRYTILATDDERHQVRIKGDNGRTRWFPAFCFSSDSRPVPTLARYQLEDPIEPNQDNIIEVTMRLSDGQRRWCIFATPMALGNCRDWIEGTQIPFYYCNRHLIIAGELSEDLIGRMLRYIDCQGYLAECTLPFANDNETKSSEQGDTMEAAAARR
jgi:hypothetical protein